MRVFLDTNVLVSAFATRGLCSDLLRSILLEHDLIVGEVVLSELRRILRQKLRLPSERISAVDDFLREHTVTPRPKRHLGLGLKDADDEWIVASAIAGKADVLVTGDADLLATRNLPLPLVSPRGLWDLLRSPDR